MHNTSQDNIPPMEEENNTKESQNTSKDPSALSNQFGISESLPDQNPTFPRSVFAKILEFLGLRKQPKHHPSKILTFQSQDGETHQIPVSDTSNIQCCGVYIQTPPQALAPFQSSFWEVGCARQNVNAELPRMINATFEEDIRGG